ncbi:unnamed protein product [Heterobilharzia americana]|nr:unnamed protein product [Heterobilharzia americana]
MYSPLDILNLSVHTTLSTLYLSTCEVWQLEPMQLCAMLCVDFVSHPFSRFRLLIAVSTSASVEGPISVFHSTSCWTLGSGIAPHSLTAFRQLFQSPPLGVSSGPIFLRYSLTNYGPFRSRSLEKSKSHSAVTCHFGLSTSATFAAHHYSRLLA